MAADTMLRGRHHRSGRPPGPGPHQWLGSPAPGDHRMDPLGPPPQMLGAPVPNVPVLTTVPPGPRTPPTGWHMAGTEESALLRPPPPNSVARPPKGQRPGQRPGPLSLVLMTLVLAIACFAGSFAGTMAGSRAVHIPALASTSVLTARTSAVNVGAQMLNWAEAHETGRPYSYGGTGPYGYDCSGAVYAAALRVLAANGIHVSWPRSTYDIESAVYSGRIRAQIIPVSQAQRGDLLIWPGWSHVEWKTKWPGVSYGAQDWGTVVGWHHYNGYWYPMLAVRILL